MSTLSELLPSGGAGGGVLEATASGALSNGDTVIVNSDGTVSVAAEITITDSTGSASVFESAQTGLCMAVYNSSANKVVVAYRDEGNSYYGTAVVGTVSGTSITFGTPIVFNSGFIYYPSAAYDSTNDKVVISYRSGSAAYAIVGTVSGTSISFGSAVLYENSQIEYQSSMCFISDSGKIAIGYTEGAVAYYGVIKIGTVSGTSISFGSQNIFEYSDARYIAITYNEADQKLVVIYADGSSARYGTAYVGTISGTSVSFGSATVFASGTTEYHAVTYDSSSQKIVTVCRDGTGTNRIRARVGTISGTSISFGTPSIASSDSAYRSAITYNAAANKIIVANQRLSSNGVLEYSVGTVSGTGISFTGHTTLTTDGADPALAYNSTDKVVVAAYTNLNNSNYGTANVIRSAYTSTNLTAENFIGIADADYSDTATATIQVAGSVDDAQTGLTAGQAYYVQTDGTLSTTPDDPSVYAGKAVSSTKLIVKG